MNDLNKVLGGLLAKGLTSEEIVDELLEQELADNKTQAISFLTQFYANWSNTEEAINRPDMHRQYHVFMRHYLLQEVLKISSTVKDMRTALAILDSLAGIHGVDMKLPEESNVPISITFVPVQVPTKESEDKESDDVNNTG